MSNVNPIISNARVYARPYGTTGGFIDLSLFRSVALQFPIDKRELADTRDGTGGLAYSHARFQKATGTMEAYEPSKTILEMALRANTTAVTSSASATKTVAWPKVGEFIPLDLFDETGTVTLSAGVLGTDAIVTRGGLLVQSVATNTEGASITVTYERVAGSRMGIMSAAAKKMELMIKGVNEINNNERIEVHIPYASFDPTNEFQLISEDFSVYSLNFDVLANPNATSLEDKFAIITKFSI